MASDVFAPAAQKTPYRSLLTAAVKDRMEACMSGVVLRAPTIGIWRTLLMAPSVTASEQDAVCLDHDVTRVKYAMLLGENLKLRLPT